MPSPRAWGRHAIWLLILLALASWSYLGIWTASVANFTGFYAAHYLAWTAAFMAVALTVVAIVNRLAPARSPIDRGYAVAAMVLILLQSQLVFDTVHDWIEQRSSTQVGLVVVVAVGMAILWLTYRVAGTPSIQIVFTSLAAFLVAIPAYDAAAYLITHVDEAPQPSAVADASPDVDPGAAPPDVYVLVVDAYARSDALRDDYGFDNTEFGAALGDLGLQIVPGALANYTFTMASIASLLDASYPLIGEPGDANVQSLETTYAGDNALFTGLRRLGYETHMFDNAWTFTTCGPSVDHCDRRVLTELDHAILQRTPIPRVLPSLRISPWVRGSVDQLRAAAELVAAPSDQPRLVFLHALIPHPPFQLDRECNYYFDPELDSYYFDQLPENRHVTAYRDQILCTNSLLLEFLEKAPQDAIVLVTSDHGARTAETGLTGSQPSTTGPTPPSHFGIFTAYRFPAACGSIPEGASLVDTGARLLDCVGAPPTVEDPQRAAGGASRHYELELGADFEVTDRSSEIRSAG